MEQNTRIPLVYPLTSLDIDIGNFISIICMNESKIEGILDGVDLLVCGQWLESFLHSYSLRKQFKFVWFILNSAYCYGKDVRNRRRH